MRGVVYSVDGPHRGQDGRQVWRIVRRDTGADGITSVIIVLECMTYSTAVKMATELTGVAARADAMSTRHAQPAPPPGVAW